MKYLPLIAALALALPVKMASQPNKAAAKDKQSAQPKSPPPTVGENNYIANDHSERPEADPPKWYAPIERPDWWLVFIAGLTGLTIAYQAREMKRATDAASSNIEMFISKERARVRIEVDLLNLQSDLAGKYEGKVHFVVSLHGSTEAFVTQSGATAYISETKDIPEYTATTMSIPQVISPDVRQTKDYTYIWPTLQFEKTDVDNIEEGRKFVQFYAFINYRDVFDRDRVTSIRCIWKAPDLPFLNGEWEITEHTET